MKNYIVLNTTKATIERFGILFPAGENTTVQLTWQQFLTLTMLKGFEVFELADEVK